VLIFGIQKVYITKEKYQNNNFNPDEKTYPGVKVDVGHSPNFVKFGVF
jgi:hypothetical protein